MHAIPFHVLVRLCNIHCACTLYICVFDSVPHIQIYNPSPSSRKSLCMYSILYMKKKNRFRLVAQSQLKLGQLKGRCIETWLRGCLVDLPSHVFALFAEKDDAKAPKTVLVLVSYVSVLTTSLVLSSLLKCYILLGICATMYSMYHSPPFFVFLLRFENQQPSEADITLPERR